MKTKTKHSVPVRASSLLCALAIVRCGGVAPGEPGEKVDPTEQEIINGTPAGNGDYSSFVYLTPSQCSGQLVTNRSVLTARHCFDNSSTTQVTMGSQTANSTRVQLHPSADLAVVRLDRAFSMVPGPFSGLSKSGYHRGFYTPTNPLPTSIYCAGYGWNSGSGGGGVLRGAVLPVYFSGSQAFMSYNTSGQIGSWGDSGMGCRLDGGLYAPWNSIVAIQSNCDNLPVPESDDNCSAFVPGLYSTWINAQLSTCSHDLCETGPKLTYWCDPCADTVCGQDGYCCDIEWDGLCVSEASSWCEPTCN